MRLKLEDFESNYFKFSNLLSVQVSHFLAVFFSTLHCIIIMGFKMELRMGVVTVGSI